MAKPKTPLRDADEHTLAKHDILREYLEAWLPIMSKWNRRLLLIDGFAGPGRYVGGEEGSPLIMLRTLLSHKARASATSRPARPLRCDRPTGGHRAYSVPKRWTTRYTSAKRRHRLVGRLAFGGRHALGEEETSA
jgi:hypothetical protein